MLAAESVKSADIIIYQGFKQGIVVCMNTKNRTRQKYKNTKNDFKKSDLGDLKSLSSSLASHAVSSAQCACMQRLHINNNK